MNNISKITEQSSLYTSIDKMSIKTIIANMNNEDLKVAICVKKVLPKLTPLINYAILAIKKGGRIFYMGAGTSGRLGVLDASEIPPTFGVHDCFIGIIAGGDFALRNAVENAEDDKNQGWKDLKKFNIHKNDLVIGLSASGSTPYVEGVLEKCQSKKIKTACIVCNKNSVIAKYSDYKIEVIVGPEFVSGSTRLKSGTAEKLILNMISTAVMIGLGRVENNQMVYMQIKNKKLFERGIKMLQKRLNITESKAIKYLKEYKSVKKSIEAHFN